MKTKGLNSLGWLGLLALTALLSACSLSFPDEGYVERDFDLHLVLQVNPDDAEVLLNGRLIGAAYEFDSSRTALRLDRRDDELVIRLKGYEEEEIDLKPLRRWSTVRLSLRPVSRLRSPYGKELAPNPRPTPTPTPAPKGKTEPLPPLPETASPDETATPVTGFVLEVAPEGSSIYLDGKFFGLAPAGGRIDNLRLSQGSHRFEVFHPGYVPYRGEVKIGQGQGATMKITLQPRGQENP